MSSYQTILLEIENKIATIIINRPDKMNAINNTVMEEIGLAVDAVLQNDAVHAAIITGAGNKAFVAGADISEFDGLSVEEGKTLARKGQVIFSKIEHSPKPIIAAVNGFALGGGCELAMACHFRIASENAKFGQPEVNLGLIPGYGGTQRLTKLIGKGRAIELLISGNLINADLAFNYGLVNRVVALEELLPTCTTLLTNIIAKAPLAVAHCIKAVNAADTAEGYEVEVDGFGFCFGTEDMVEGTAAFIEKRKADFKGK